MNAAQREGTRHAMLRSATVALKHAGVMRYSEGPDRWSGITEKRRSWLGEYPPAADCSSFVTWCAWDASRWLDWPDMLNGDDWQGGYTQTLIAHGEHIDAPALVGDLILYGSSVENTTHVAMYIGGGRIISHGSQGGPYLLAYDYRDDIVAYRRYIV